MVIVWKWTTKVSGMQLPKQSHRLNGTTKSLQHSTSDHFLPASLWRPRRARGTRLWCHGALYGEIIWRSSGLLCHAFARQNRVDMKRVWGAASRYVCCSNTNSASTRNISARNRQQEFATNVGKL